LLSLQSWPSQLLAWGKRLAANPRSQFDSGCAGADRPRHLLLLARKKGNGEEVAPFSLRDQQVDVLPARQGSIYVRKSRKRMIRRVIVLNEGELKKY